MLKLLNISLILLTLWGCQAYHKVSNQNLYFSYRKEFNTMHPEYAVFHETDTTSTIYYNFSWSEFLFIKALGDSGFRSSARLSYRLLQDYESKTLLDSSSITLYTLSPASTYEGIESGSFSVKSKGQKSALLEITLTDIRRNQFVRHFITLDRSDPGTRQNFLVSSQGEVLMKYILNNPDTVLIRHVSPLTKQLHVRYYHRNFPLAAPPFSDYLPKPFEYKADSLFLLTDDGSGVFRLPVTEHGFYHVQTDTIGKEGLTLFLFHQDYPFLSTPEELLKPLRYLTSKKEYDDIQLASNKKAAIDEFWLSNAGSSARAKELIRTFYNRVQDANQYFASYLEGWKTDRGLLYLIYGPPTAVYRTNNSESWVYGEENNIRSLHFTFVKVMNPFTENDYSLVRNENYKDSWYVAVDTWRQGRVFAD